MRSGDPDPVDDLKLIIETKRHQPAAAVDVVSDAAAWLKAALKGANLAFSYSSCQEEHYGYAVITLLRSHRGQPVSLDLKVAEIQDRPYVFAEVRSLGRFGGTMFPFFSDMQSDDSRELLLHYISDFILSTEGQDASPAPQP
mgnify:CR=1 FL=1